jgi:hypothetical protein
MQANTDVCVFWDNVDKATLQTHASWSVVLLPPGVFWLGARLFGRKLFIRACYPILFDMINADWVSALEYPKPLCLFGSPGVGKSAFLCYLIWKLRLQQPTGLDIVLHHPAFVYRFRSGAVGNYVEQSLTLTTFFESICTWGCYYLADAVEPCFCQEGRLAKTLVVGRQAPRFLKQEVPKIRYMSPLDWPEVEAMRSCVEFLHDDGARRVVERAEAEERFRKLGGQARYVLAHRNESAAQLVHKELVGHDFRLLMRNQDINSELIQYHGYGKDLDEKSVVFS